MPDIMREKDGPQATDTQGASDAGLTVVFDGDCPVCTAYSCNLPIKGPNQVINAREGGKLVENLTAAGVDLDEGMVVIHEGRYHHGADAVHMMALHSRADGFLARLNHLVFRSRARSRALYPVLRFGRNLLLRMLGRTRIDNLRRAGDEADAMSKRAAAWMVIAFFAVFFGAVFLRIDYYPFTWVPMYGERETNAELNVKIGGLDKRGKGFRATLADGRVVYVNSKDLNLPAANFRRLYNERMFGEGPPQHRRERRALNAFNNWWYETLVGPWTIKESMYPQQVLDAVNKTLGRGPSDPDRVVKLQAEIGQVTLTREHRGSGDLGALLQADLVATVTPEGQDISVAGPPVLKHD